MAFNGPVSTNDYPPESEGGINPSGFLRKELDLYANIRPAKSFVGLPPRVGDHIDLIIAVKTPRGFILIVQCFLGGQSLCRAKIWRYLCANYQKSIKRIARTAFALAAERRRKITVVHKANVFRVSDGLFLEAVRAVRDEFPDFEYEEQIVDAMAAF